MRLLLLLLFISSLAFGQKTASLDQKIKEFDQYVENGRKQWEVPGLALAVVKTARSSSKKDTV
ncbi:MAG: hypothetical protein WDN75_09145 [Bacteroidota bacterium]